MDTEIVTDNSILTAPVLNVSPSTPDATSSSSYLNWSTILRYTLIILILAFLGFNIFTYLGKSTDFLTNFFRPIISIFGYGVTSVTKQTIDTTARGTKEIVDITAGAATGGINLLENTLAGKANKLKEEKKSVDAALQASVNTNTPLPDDAGSRTQASKAKSKAGYCYIGEDRGFRSCIHIGEGDSCMSGDIFPTMEQCINPNLR